MQSTEEIKNEIEDNLTKSFFKETIKQFETHIDQLKDALKKIIQTAEEIEHKSSLNKQVELELHNENNYKTKTNENTISKLDTNANKINNQVPKEDVVNNNNVNINDSLSRELNKSGILYCEKKGRNYELAVQSFMESAINNNRAAINNLGVLYYKGFGVERNFKKAAEYFALASEQGFKVANFNLGYCYERGEGVEKDLKKAFECYLNSNCDNFPLPKMHLAFFHKFGLGCIPKDEILAEFYGSLARNANLPPNKSTLQHAYLWSEEPENFSITQKLNLENAAYSLIDLRYFFVFDSKKDGFLSREYAKYPLIYKAAFEGNIKIFEECLNKLKPGDINKMQLDTGETPLNLAVLGCSPKIVDRLLELGCDPHFGWMHHEKFGSLSSGHLATFLNTNNILKKLIKNNLNLNTKQLQITGMQSDRKATLLAASYVLKHSILDIAICAGDADSSEFIQTLIDAGAEVNTINANGITPLMTASKLDFPKVVKLLCDHKADINIKDVQGNSALSIACTNSCNNCVEILLNDENCKLELYPSLSGGFITSIGIAIENNHILLLNIILNSKAFLKSPEYTGKYTPPNLNNPNSLIKSLGEFGQILHERLPQAAMLCAVPALFLAVELGRTEMVKILLEKTDNLLEELNPKFEKNCLQTAIEKGFLDIVEMLLQHFDINEQDENGKTYLHYLIDAAPKNSVDIAFLLLSKNVNPDLKDHKGISAFNKCLIKKNEIDNLIKNKIDESIHLGEITKTEITINQWRFIRTILIEIIKKKFHERFILCQKYDVIKKCINSYSDEISFNKEYNILLLYIVGIILKLSLSQAPNDNLLFYTEHFDNLVFSKHLKKYGPSIIELKPETIDKIIKHIFSNKLLGKKLTHLDFTKILWNCSDEKIQYEKMQLNRKNAIEKEDLKNKKNDIESKLFWLPNKLTKYLHETLKINDKRKQIPEIITDIKEYIETFITDADYAVKKRNGTENILLEISNYSKKLMEQELRFKFSFKKFEPKIKLLLKEDNIKEAIKLLNRLTKIYSGIENLADRFKKSFQLLEEIQYELQDKYQHEKYLRNIQHQKNVKQNNKEDYFQTCLKKLKEVENKLKTIEENYQKKSTQRKSIKNDAQKNKNISTQNQLQKNISTQKHNDIDSQDIIAIRDKEVKKLLEKHKQEQTLKQIKKQIETHTEKQTDKQIERQIQNQRSNQITNQPNQTTQVDNSNKNTQNLMLDYMSYVEKQSLDLQIFSNELNSNNNDINIKGNENLNQILNDELSQFEKQTLDSKPKKMSLFDFNIVPQLKAHEELEKLRQLLETISFLPLERTQLISRMERTAILGIVARAMECYKNISIQRNASLTRKNNIFKILAKLFRDTVFHPTDDKLFKPEVEDIKINADLNRPFVDMACKLLSFLNDPKWKKQSITFDDIFQNFKDDLFLKIIFSSNPKQESTKKSQVKINLSNPNTVNNKMVTLNAANLYITNQNIDLLTKIETQYKINKPTPSFCKEQILAAWQEIIDYNRVKDMVPKVLYQASVGFQIAKIGSFASVLINQSNADAENLSYRKVFNQLRRYYNIPLGQFIQKGIAFRHVLSAIEIIPNRLKI